MKKSILFVLLLALISCTPKDNTSGGNVIHSITKDFPVSTEVELELRKEFDIVAERYPFAIDGSTMWLRAENDGSAGDCYDINSGKKISRIINKGKANNELFSANYKLSFMGDTVNIIRTSWSTINIISLLKSDILAGKSMNERYTKITKIEEDFNSKYSQLSNALLFPDSTLLVLNAYAIVADTTTLEERFVVIDKDGKSYFGDLYKNIEETNSEGDAFGSVTLGARVDDRIGEPADLTNVMLYSYGPLLATYQNKVVVVNRFGLSGIEIIDVKEKRVTNRKAYSKVMKLKGQNKIYTTEKIRIGDVKCNEKYIYMFADYVEKLDAENRPEIFENCVYVFDWNLNPVKKFVFPDKLNELCGNAPFVDSMLAHDCSLAISEDCKSIYFMKNEGEKQKLYEAKLEI